MVTIFFYKKDEEIISIEEQISYEEIRFSFPRLNSLWQETELTCEYFDKAEVSTDQIGFSVVQIKFTSEGQRIFGEKV